jgi:hypothetical protein
MAKTKDEPVVEDVDDDEISSDDDSDDVPELEEADGSARGKQSKMEKKSRCVKKRFLLLAHSRKMSFAYVGPIFGHLAVARTNIKL